VSFRACTGRPSRWRRISSDRSYALGKLRKPEQVQAGQDLALRAKSNHCQTGVVAGLDQFDGDLLFELLVVGRGYSSDLLSPTAWHRSNSRGRRARRVSQKSLAPQDYNLAGGEVVIHVEEEGRKKVELLSRRNGTFDPAKAERGVEQS